MGEISNDDKPFVFHSRYFPKRTVGASSHVEPMVDCAHVSCPVTVILPMQETKVIDSLQASQRSVKRNGQHMTLT